MELRHLRYFLAVAKAEHVGRAAASLNVSQPALSQQIKDLELEIGKPLFERHPKGVRLTEPGKTLQPFAQRAIHNAQAGLIAARAVASGWSSEVRFGLPETTGALALVKPAIERFRQTHPDVLITIAGTPWLEQIAAVQNFDLDLGFVWTGGARAPASYPSGLTGLRIREDLGEYALMGADHPLAKVHSLSIEQLRPFPFGLFDRALHPDLHDFLMGHLRRVGFSKADIARGVTSTVNSITHFQVGNGWTLITNMAAADPLPGVVARHIRDLGVPAGLDVIWRADDDRGLIAQFVELLSRPIEAAR